MVICKNRRLCSRRRGGTRPARTLGLGVALGAQDAHHNEVFPAVGIEFGFPADPFLAEAAGQEGVRREAELYPDGWKDFIMMGILRAERDAQAEGPGWAGSAPSPTA